MNIVSVITIVNTIVSTPFSKTKIKNFKGLFYTIFSEYSIIIFIIDLQIIRSPDNAINQ
jgi:hypothetical protein